MHRAACWLGNGHVAAIDAVGIHHSVCTEAKLGSFGWMGQMLPCLVGTFIHLSTGMCPLSYGHCILTLQSRFLPSLLPRCSTGSRCREHCLRLLILRKQTSEPDMPGRCYLKPSD